MTRFYCNVYPEVDELVMVQVKQIQEMGACVPSPPSTPQGSSTAWTRVMSQLLKTSATASCAPGTRTDALLLYRYVKLVRRVIAEGVGRDGTPWDGC